MVNGFNLIEMRSGAVYGCTVFAYVEATMAIGGVQFSVIDDGETVLVYKMATLAEAVERLEFIREFFPRAQFVFEPLTH